MKYIRILLIAASIIVVLVAGYGLWRHQPPKTGITSFETCAAAGYPVQESSPAVCVTPDGRSFKQETTL